MFFFVSAPNCKPVNPNVNIYGKLLVWLISVLQKPSVLCITNFSLINLKDWITK